MKEAGFVFWKDEDWKPEDAIIDWATDYDREIKKFAELIIRECANIADTDEKRPNYFGCGYITKTTGDKIQEHFGLKQ